ncbi:hypothetical protein AB0I93_26760 [Streptomyces sp. NPDC049967]|uniref:hypothetical protein n=1 Tax=Streptomyces sp. NPDC049967 TaxID=3155658 RepID=UPI0034333BF7
MPRFLIAYPKNQGGDVLVEDSRLTLAIADGWAVLSDERGVCLAIPSHSGVTITRIDEPAQD